MINVETAPVVNNAEVANESLDDSLPLGQSRFKETSNIGDFFGSFNPDLVSIVSPFSETSFQSQQSNSENEQIPQDLLFGSPFSNHNHSFMSEYLSFFAKISLIVYIIHLIRSPTLF